MNPIQSTALEHRAHTQEQDQLKPSQPHDRSRLGTHREQSDSMLEPAQSTHLSRPRLRISIPDDKSFDFPAFVYTLDQSLKRSLLANQELQHNSSFDSFPQNEVLTNEAQSNQFRKAYLAECKILNTILDSHKYISSVKKNEVYELLKDGSPLVNYGEQMATLGQHSIPTIKGIIKTTHTINLELNRLQTNDINEILKNYPLRSYDLECFDGTLTRLEKILEDIQQAQISAGIRNAESTLQLISPQLLNQSQLLDRALQQTVVQAQMNQYIDPSMEIHQVLGLKLRLGVSSTAVAKKDIFSASAVQKIPGPVFYDSITILQKILREKINIQLHSPVATNALDQFQMQLISTLSPLPSPQSEINMEILSASSSLESHELKNTETQNIESYSPLQSSPIQYSPLQSSPIQYSPIQYSPHPESRETQSPELLGTKLNEIKKNSLEKLLRQDDTSIEQRFGVWNNDITEMKDWCWSSIEEKILQQITEEWSLIDRQTKKGSFEGLSYREMTDQPAKQVVLALLGKHGSQEQYFAAQYTLALLDRSTPERTHYAQERHRVLTIFSGLYSLKTGKHKIEFSQFADNVLHISKQRSDNQINTRVLRNLQIKMNTTFQKRFPYSSTSLESIIISYQKVKIKCPLSVAEFTYLFDLKNMYEQLKPIALKTIIWQESTNEIQLKPLMDYANTTADPYAAEFLKMMLVGKPNLLNTLLLQSIDNAALSMQPPHIGVYHYLTSGFGKYFPNLNGNDLLHKQYPELTRLLFKRALENEDQELLYTLNSSYNGRVNLLEIMQIELPQN